MSKNIGNICKKGVFECEERPKKIETISIDVSTEDNASHYLEITVNDNNKTLSPAETADKPSRVTIARPINLAVSIPYKKPETNHNNMEKLYIEADISSIDVSSMKNYEHKLEDYEAIMLEGQDILELNIVVKPPITYV